MKVSKELYQEVETLLPIVKQRRAEAAMAHLEGVWMDQPPVQASAETEALAEAVSNRAVTAVLFDTSPLNEEGEVDVVSYINVTPHPITLTGTEETRLLTDTVPERPIETLVVPPSGLVVDALPVEQKAGCRGAVRLVTTGWAAEPEALEVLQLLKGHIVLGSLIAAQAYPGLVLALVPAPGFERVPPAEKRMRADKFTVFTAGSAA